MVLGGVVQFLGLGTILMDLLMSIFQLFLPILPGEFFPFFFGETVNGYPILPLQRALIAAIVIGIVSGYLGNFLLAQNLALIGDGLAHVSFGALAVVIVVIGATTDQLWYALIITSVCAVIIHELQYRQILTGDTSIAILMTGMLGLGLVILRIGEVPLLDFEGYLFGDLYSITEYDLNFIVFCLLISMLLLAILRPLLLAMIIDPISARIQGIPVRAIGIIFSIVCAIVIISMVKVIGALLATALLVTPAATAQLVSRSFKSCLLWTQFFGLLSVFMGLYFSAELGTGGGSMIAVVAAIIFAIVAICKASLSTYSKIKHNQN